MFSQESGFSYVKTAWTESRASNGPSLGGYKDFQILSAQCIAPSMFG